MNTDPTTIEAAMAKLAADYPPDAELIYRSAGQVPLSALIYRPFDWHESDRRPAIVMFFGGGWRMGTALQFAPQAEHWRRRGLVVVLPWYRVRARHGTSIPDCIRDARSALRWVGRESVALGVDPDRIIAGGGSAGGHLAAASPLVKFDHAEDAKSPLPMLRALLLFNPALHLSSPHDAVLRLTAGFGMSPETLARCDPNQHLSLPYPPTLIQHGTSDSVVPFAAAKDFADRLHDIGGTVRLLPYEGRGHGFFNLVSGRGDFDKSLRVADGFIETYL